MYHTYVKWKSSVLSENISSSFFHCILIVLVIWSLYLSFVQKIFNFINYPSNPLFYHTYVRLKSSVLSENVSNSFFRCILIAYLWLSLYLSVFSKKCKFISVILCNPHFYHAYFTWKSSVLSENISTSLFNCLLIVFVCRSLYLSVFTNKSSILSIISCNPQFSHTYVRWRSSLHKCILFLFQ